MELLPEALPPPLLQDLEAPGSLRKGGIWFL